MKISFTFTLKDHKIFHSNSNFSSCLTFSAPRCEQNPETSKASKKSKISRKIAGNWRKRNECTLLGELSLVSMCHGNGVGGDEQRFIYNIIHLINRTRSAFGIRNQQILYRFFSEFWKNDKFERYCVVFVVESEGDELRWNLYCLFIYIIVYHYYFCMERTRKGKRNMINYKAPPKVLWNTVVNL